MNPVLAILGTLALYGLLASFILWARRADRRLGRQAFRDGLPLNVRWSRPMRDGWAEAWGAHLRRSINNSSPRSK